jgi:Tfp pilus assembly protein PilF
MPDRPKRHDAPALNREAVAALNRNDAAQAEGLLLQVLAADPDDASALQLMGIVRRMQNRLQEAEDYYLRSVVVDPARPQVHHNLGNLLAAQNRFDDAITVQREAIRLKPNYVEAHLALALAFSAAGDHEAAEKSCRQALRYQPNYQSAKQALAAELNDLDRPKEAEQILRQMLLLGMSDSRAIAASEHNLGVALKAQGRWEEALPLFDAARAKVPGLLAVDYNQGDTLQHLGRYEEAIGFFRRALQIELDNVKILASIALASAQSNDFAGARIYGERAVARDAHNGVALVALSMADIDDGEFATAERRLDLVLDDLGASSEERVNHALGMAADALDRHGQVSAAFTVYSASNERRRLRGAATFERARAITEVQRLITYFESSDPWPARPNPLPQSDAAAGHVFVLGFMRSGTTLLTTALASHAEVVAIDERELLTEPARAFLLDEGGLNRLALLDDREAARWRNAYWNSVHAAGFKIAGKVFVDKMPFNSIRLPLIARLFPDAKTIFAVRDPRDVVLSCFRRRFDMSPYSFEFLRLHDCARFYASVMTLAERYRENLPLKLLQYRYEDMVADFESSVRGACSFIGIDWRDSMRDFSASADAINRRSASARQVRRSLYNDAAGQWRRYREQLAPVFPILQPWVERFGYPPV